MSNDVSRAGTANQINAYSFQAFLEGWLVRQEHYLDELNSAQHNCHESRDEDLRELISRVLSHYQQYYKEKSSIAQNDIFLVFSPPWFTSLELAFLWVAGFKPGMAFKLVMSSVNDLTEDQVRRINRLRDETRVEERALNDELAKVQESVAAPPLLDLFRPRRRSLNESNVGEYEGRSLNTLKSVLEMVLSSADLLRTNTVMKIVEILRSVQNVKFLTAASQFQLRVRTWGLQKDAGRQQSVGFGKA